MAPVTTVLGPTFNSKGYVPTWPAIFPDFLESGSTLLLAAQAEDNGLEEVHSRDRNTARENDSAPPLPS